MVNIGFVILVAVAAALAEWLVNRELMLAFLTYIAVQWVVLMVWFTIDQKKWSIL